MKLHKLERGLAGHDTYSVAFGNWDNYPVISMSDKYTLYRSKLVERMMTTMVTLEILSTDDVNNFISRLNDNDMRVVLMYKLSERKTYLRFKHYAKTNCLNTR